MCHDDGMCPADDAVAHTQHHGATTTIGHANGHVHGQANGMTVIGWPFLEVEVLRFQRVGVDLIQPGKQRADFGEFPHRGRRRG